MYISQEVKHKIHNVLAAIILVAGAFGFILSVQAYPRFFKINAQLEADRDIKPKQEIRVKFSEPMLCGQLVKIVAISPQTEVEFDCQEGNRMLAVTPLHYWKPERAYQVVISKARSAMLTEISAQLNFRTIDYPKILEFYPAPEERDVLLDIEDPITASFDKPISDFHVKFIIRPLEDLVYQLNSEKTKVQLLAENELERGQFYSIEILARYKDAPDADYQKIFETSFETRPLPPITWEKNLTLRLEQAKRFTEPRIFEGKYIDLNLKSQVMTIFENGKLLDAYLISSGKPGMPTPQGTFNIANKFPRAWSRKYGLFMPYWMALVPSGDFGIHELPEWPGGFKEGKAHLGTPVSHGCVRLGVGPAERIYNWTEIETPVVIHE